MNAKKFPEVNTTFAKDQPQYRQLPASVSPDGVATFCWHLTLRERFVLLINGELWHQVLTFNKPLQPQLLAVDKPVLTVDKAGK